MLADVVLCRVEAVTIKVQTQPGFAVGLHDGFPKIIKSYGAFWYGYIISCDYLFLFLLLWVGVADVCSNHPITPEPMKCCCYQLWEFYKCWNEIISKHCKAHWPCFLKVWTLEFIVFPFVPLLAIQRASSSLVACIKFHVSSRFFKFLL